MRRVLQTWATSWRALRAWGRPLEEITIEIVGRNGHKEPGQGGYGSSGIAYPIRRHCRIRAGVDLPDALATVLHEYAHLGAPAEAGHSLPWRSRFVEAAREVTGILVSTDGTKEQVDQSVTDAIRSWWKSSGNEFAVSLLKRDQS